MELTVSERQRILNYHGQLKSARSSYDKHWELIEQYIAPRRTRFQGSEKGDGSRRNGKLINSSPTRSRRILGSGMMAGITSPARPWFRLTTSDPGLAELTSVRYWLDWCEQRIRTGLSKSNFYNCLASFYPDIGSFATQVLWIEPDPEDVISCELLPVGRFCLDSDGRRISVITTESRRSAQELMTLFGDRCSTRVKDAYRKADYTAQFDILHILEPNRERDPRKLDASGKLWTSKWLELDNQHAGGFLREAGYETFPACPTRWEVTGEDVYGGNCPGMASLGDLMHLQELERRKNALIDKSSSPPMNAPAGLQRASLLAGDVNYHDAPAGGIEFKPALTIHPTTIQQVREEIGVVQQRIDQAFYADLFLLLSESDRRQVTATEIAAKQEERLLQIGPVLESLHKELLRPAIARVFEILARAGQIPEPPPELDLGNVRIEYISIMAQAQKLVGITANERLLNTVGAAAQVQAAGAAGGECVDKLIFDELIDDTAERLGVKPSVVRSDEDVAAMRAQRAAAMQAQQQAAMAQQVAATARDLGNTPVGDDNALGQLMNGLSPVANAGTSAGV